MRHCTAYKERELRWTGWLQIRESATVVIRLQRNSNRFVAVADSHYVVVALAGFEFPCDGHEGFPLGFVPTPVSALRIVTRCGSGFYRCETVRVEVVGLSDE